MLLMDIIYYTMKNGPKLLTINKMAQRWLALFGDKTIEIFRNLSLF